MGKRLHNDQSGLASLVIAILIVIILTTMITGFLQIIGHEQRRSLDRQLGSQAFYAAESGVNDASKAISNGYKADKTSCKPYAAASGYPTELSGASNNLTTNTNVRYTCLLIDQTPGSLEYNPINAEHGSTFVAESVTGFMDSLNFSWQDSSGSTKFRTTAATTGTDFPTQGSWNSGGIGTGILRVDLLPINASSTSRVDIINNTRTYFFYPSSNPAAPNTVDYLASQSGAVINGRCASSASPHYCNVTISNINASNLPGITASKVYVRMRAIYNPVNVTVNAFSLGNAVSIRGAQILVDSTGRAADVSRRIQVRIPQQNIDLPDFTIASMDTLCKKYVLYSNGVAADGTGGAPDTSGVCNPANW